MGFYVYVFKNKYCLLVPFVIFIDLISTFRFRGGVDHMNFSGFDTRFDFTALRLRMLSPNLSLSC